MRSLTGLQEAIVSCTRCPRLVAHREEVAEKKRPMYADWEYWGRPVPSFGDPGGRLLIIGLAPAAHGANRTGRMFTGDRSGDLLYRTLHKLGFASSPESRDRDDGLSLHDAYVTAAVRCAPPANKPLREELANCRPYLIEELALVGQAKVVVALGRVAFDSYLAIYRERGIAVASPRPRFGHGAAFTMRDGIQLIGSYHPSQQNTQTGRLTAEMFEDVFRKAKEALDHTIPPVGQVSDPSSPRSHSPDLLDRSLWHGVAGKSPELADNPEGTEHLVYRFVGQYLPAVLRARTSDDRERAWLALWSYMIARPTMRKPFGLSHEAADRLIAEFQEAVSRETDLPQT